MVTREVCEMPCGTDGTHLDGGSELSHLHRKACWYVNHAAAIGINVWSRPFVVTTWQRLAGACPDIVPGWYGIRRSLLSHLENVSGFDVTEAENFRVVIRGGNGGHRCVGAVELIPQWLTTNWR